MVKLEKGFWLIYKSKVCPFVVGYYETRDRPNEVMSILNSNNLILIEESE